MIKNEIIDKKYKNKTIVVDQYEFEDIAAEFINCEQYMLLSSESHHGGERLTHSFKVAKATYQIAKSLGLDYKSATRAAFLHDFFFNSTFDEAKTSLEKAKEHPELALENSQKYFNINDKEADAILNHMYPLTPNKPESLEGITLSVVDKGVAITDRISALYNKRFAKKTPAYNLIKIKNKNW